MDIIKGKILFYKKTEGGLRQLSIKTENSYYYTFLIETINDIKTLEELEIDQITDELSDRLSNKDVSFIAINKNIPYRENEVVYRTIMIKNEIFYINAVYLESLKAEIIDIKI